MGIEDAVIGSALGTGIAAIIGAVFLLAVIVFAALYVYTALAVRSIAKKTRSKPLWLAWVPVANIVLLLKSAKLEWQWIFGLLVVFVPFVGKVLLALGSLYVWWQICIQLKKQQWLSILMIVPFVNLVVLGYLAWSK